MRCRECPDFTPDNDIAECFGQCKKFTAMNFDTSRSRPVFFSGNQCQADYFIAEYSERQKNNQMSFDGL